MVLARRIVALQNCTLAEAGYQIEAFNEQVHKTLQSGQHMPVENLGYLYLDAHGAIQFQPQQRINHSDVFGLPHIQAHALQTTTVRPFGSAVDVFEPTPLIHVTSGASGALAKPKGNIFLPALHPAVAAVFAMGIGVAMGLSYHSMQRASPKTDELVQVARINVPPRVNNTSYEPAPLPISVPTIIETKQATRPLSPSDIPPAPPAGKAVNKATFIIGAFSNISNVKKAKATIRSQGHTPYVDTKNGLTRVGATIEYGNKTQLDEDIYFLKKSFGNAVRLK